MTGSQSRPVTKVNPKVTRAVSRDGLSYLRSGEQEEMGALVTVKFSKMERG